MKTEPKEPYVYQPGGVDVDKKYGVGGAKDRLPIKGLSKKDALEIVRVMKENPEFAISFYDGVKKKLNLTGGEKLSELVAITLNNQEK